MVDKKMLDSLDPDAQLWSKFQFNVPINLVKGEETEQGWKIQGVASTEDKDLQGEIVRQHGLDISPIKEGRGWINYNHSNDPEDMVGKLDDASLTNKGMNIEGYLFKKHKRAQGVYQILKSLDDKDRHAVSLSIEGKIMKRSGKSNKVISSAKVDKVAITFDPINTNTYVELCKALTRKGEGMEKSFEAKESDINKDNDIMTEQDQKQESHAANASDSAKMVEEDRGDGIDLPNSNYSGQQEPAKPNTYELLQNIDQKLSMLLEYGMADQKEKTIKSLKGLISDKVKKAFQKLD